MRTLGCSSVKGLKRVSKGSASIYQVSIIRDQLGCATYHSLQRLIALLLAGLALVLAFLAFRWHLHFWVVCCAKARGALRILDSWCTWRGLAYDFQKAPTN